MIQLGELLADGVKGQPVDRPHDELQLRSVRWPCACCSRCISTGSATSAPLTVKRLVQLATLDGAVDLGIANRTGSLTPGKRADMILVRTTDINMTPMGDPYEALVSLAQPATSIP